MSNIDKQALREEFKMMQDCYSDPADRDRQVIYLAAEALLDELEAKDKQIGDLKATAAHSNAGWKEAHEQEARAEAAEKRIAELQAREGVVNIKPPVIGRAYSALNRVWTEQEVRKACELAGIKLHIAAAGKGEAS